MHLLHHGPRVTVFCGAFEEARTWSPRLFDHVITDPPYTQHVHSNIRSCNTTGAVRVKEWEPGFAPLENYEHVPLALYLSRRWVLMFCALEQFGEYVEAAGGMWSSKRKGAYIRSGIWRKKQAAPQLSGDRPANSCEGIAAMHARGDGASRIAWNDRGRHAYWSADETGEGFDLFINEGREKAEKRHPAQKPEGLAIQLCQQFIWRGEHILDPYAGSGALAWAALRVGAGHVTLIERDPEWALHCVHRAREFEAAV